MEEEEDGDEVEGDVRTMMVNLTPLSAEVSVRTLCPCPLTRPRSAVREAYDPPAANTRLPLVVVA